MKLPILAAMVALTQIAGASPVTVTARQLGPAPGAIVCRDLATVSAMFELYAEAWETGAQARLTDGASAELESPYPGPQLEAYGCALAKAGTRMTLVRVDGAAAVVILHRKGRKPFSGVTQSNMYIPAAPRSH
ncbi:MAG: hypothetical protein ACLGPM_07785 [Acidobacteriota bacterium]